MKKTITITLEYEPNPDWHLDDIRRDLESEISCCSYHYELKDVTIEDYDICYPLDSPEEPPRYRPYRPWNVLLQEPADMTDEEKTRLNRINQIPKVVFDVCMERVTALRNQVMELEEEVDGIIDYLNGEEQK